MATTINFDNEHITNVECGQVSTEWAYADISVYIEVDGRHAYAVAGRWRFERRQDGQWASRVPDDHLEVSDSGWNDTEPGDDHHNRVRALLDLYTPSIVAELPRIRTAAIEAQIAKLEGKLTRLRAQLAS